MAVESQAPERPGSPPLINVADYEQRARDLLAPGAWHASFGDYGDPEWETNTNNVDGFAQLYLRPRILVDVSRRDLTTRVLDVPASLPVLVAPSGLQQRWTREGELAMTRAAAAAGTIMALSTVASYSIEEIAAAAECPLFFQLYWMRERRITENLVRRAEAAGFRAVIVTVDIPGVASRERDKRYSWNLTGEEYTTVEKERILRNFRGVEPGTNVPTWATFNASVDDSVTWRDLEWLRMITTLPIVIKGLQTAEDARLCAEHGIDGIVVSNHGGFALDGSRATVAALPEVVDAAGASIEVYLDGGVRRGTDVLKALALGATAVFVGRAALWGLAVAAEDGARHVFEIIRGELDRAMAHCGVDDVKTVGADLVGAV
jgi:4-hydroxymandelate oxidase